MIPSARSPYAWTEFRFAGTLATVVILLVCAGIWRWQGGFVLAGLAAVAFGDAYLRRRRNSTSLLSAVLVDTTLLGAGLVVADLDPAGVGAPYLYLMAVPLLLLPMRWALPVMGYVTAWGAMALTIASPFPLPTSIDRTAITVAAYVVFTVLLLALIAVLGRSVAAAQDLTDRRLHAEAALAVAGAELLSNVEEDALLNALEGIREATGAAAAFVAENSGDRRTGPAAVVRQVSAAADSLTHSNSMRWTLPYMQHREAAAELANGRWVRLDEPLGMVMGREPGTTSAIGVPISVRGEWAGFLGIAYTGDLPSPEPDIGVLETIAAMIGAFMERQEAYERLETMVNSKDRFLAGVSHEIRTPLTSILGFASILAEEPGSLETEEALDLIKLIRLQAQDVSDLVEDLLVGARTEINAVTINPEPVVLSNAIDRVLAGRFDTEDRDIFVASSPRHVAIADPSRIRQILRNLLTNAVRYGGNEITITTHRDAPEVTVVFSDNGDGVPSEQRRRIFDPYHRGQEAMTKADSIGLGLAVSRQLARLMDGDLTLRSDLGPATFQLSLPMEPSVSEGEEPDQETVLASGSNSLEA